MAKKSMRVIGEYTMITAATFVVAAAVYFFLIPSGVSVGSISGLAMLLGNVIPLPISVLTFILNAALLVVGFLFIGREFGVKTVYTSLILPVFLWVFEQVFPDFVSINQDAMMDTVCRFAMELSEKIRAMGSSMSTTAQNSFTFRSGSSPASRDL